MYDFEQLDYYELLGVARSATVDEIKKAFRREVSKYHPDRFLNAPADEQEYARRRTQALTEAHATLTDFTSRNAYNRGQARPQQAILRPTTAAPRDHQAELYDQARDHLQAGRVLQAIGTLRQLQQLNPFYRDSAELLAQAEAEIQRRSAPPPPPERPQSTKRRPVWMVAGGLAGAAFIAAAAVAFRGRDSNASVASVTSQPTVAITTTLPTTAPAVLASSPEPSQPPATIAPTDVVITLAPPTNPPAPTAPPETGRVVASDPFTQQSWADTSGNGWTVGYQDGGYRITAVPGAGVIWSYRTGNLVDYSLSVDMQAESGTGGVLLRFTDRNNYLSFVVDSQTRTYRFDQISAGTATELANGFSPAIQTTTNRLTARIQGRNITLLANGQELESLTLPEPSSGVNYGLLAIGGESRADIRFDNLELRAIE